MQHQCVAVRIGEEGHMADARVERLAVELDPLRLELVARRGHIRNAQRNVRAVRRGERRADVLHAQEIQADVLTELVLGEPAGTDLRQAERLTVEPLRPLHVCHRHRDAIGAFDDQPTEPSTCSWISRFISTAYSSGSSFVIGSTKPDTIIALASASVSPRDMREKSCSSPIFETVASCPMSTSSASILMYGYVSERDSSSRISASQTTFDFARFAPLSTC